MSEIVLQRLTFSNMFSYGADNSIALDENRITQLTAGNGAGKTTIAHVIQELLYSKNIKGVKKGDIVNRYSGDKTWSGKLHFTVDGMSYRVEVKRSTTATKVALYKQDVDISEHKIVDTYKKLQDILGLDFDVFSQITYQSSTDLLDFLKATDTNRKKFLINLFNLERYVTIGEQIKTRSSQVDKDITKLEGELKSINDFLQSTVIPEPQQYKPEVVLDMTLSVRLADVERELLNINDTCKRIDKNNMYILERNKLTFDLSMQPPATFEHAHTYQALKFDLTKLNADIADMQREYDQVRINDVCSACGQQIDTSHLVHIQQELHNKIQQAKQTYSDNLTLAKQWSQQLTDYQTASKAYALNEQSIARFEQLTQLIDDNTPTAYPDFQALTAERTALQSRISEQAELVKRITAHNKGVSAYNAKIEALVEQKSDFIIRQQAVTTAILDKSSEANALSVLKKAFSTSGIVAFKLESLTKELETAINHYLSSLSDGQFQVEFSLDKEKLNINVINNGISSPIETMSGGEFSRIQTSVLLAIRSLLSNLGGSSINLLFLDEIMAVLDDQGKEGLIEVLQREQHLNVFLISHEYTHPLINKIAITKTDNISCIQG